MSPTGWMIIGGIFLLLVLWRTFMPSLDKAVAQAVRENDLGPVREAIAKRSESAQPAGYNHAVRRLWESYQRPMAIELIKDMAGNFGTAPITQYWIDVVLKVEPQMAREKFSKGFLNTYYQPEVAAKCGSAG
ncbi:MAG TPA: hypothetical protein VM425_11640 [Myxococcota bacterium]|nr:hypothetical protein [Myxococcota bacterium]